MQTHSYRAPDLAPEEATPHRVRDELVLCLAAALSTTRRAPNASPNSIMVRNDAERFLRGAFEEAGHDFAQPTADSLRLVLDRWREAGGGFTDDATVIQYHWNEMNKLVSQVA